MEHASATHITDIQIHFASPVELPTLDKNSKHLQGVLGFPDHRIEEHGPVYGLVGVLHIRGDTQIAEVSQTPHSSQRPSNQAGYVPASPKFWSNVDTS